MVGGVLTWPTENAELDRGNNTASILAREAPSGDYTVETKIHFDPKESAQQAGLVLYENDDRYFKLVHSVLPLNNGAGTLLQVSEFVKEGERLTSTSPADVFNGRMFVGPPAETMWLRLSHHVNLAKREHEVRAGTSRDGEHWTQGGVWTMPVRGNLKIGLVSMNRGGAVARFYYVRTYL